jgi:uncharacterized oligopeptide transporter (OPT) family protein
MRNQQNGFRRPVGMINNAELTLQMRRNFSQTRAEQRPMRRWVFVVRMIGVGMILFSALVLLDEIMRRLLAGTTGSFL